MIRDTTVSPRFRTREEILRLIRDSQGITRPSLCEATGLSPSAVGHVVARLKADGLVKESDPEEKGPGTGSGRPAILLTAVDQGSAVAGIDFGHSHIRVAIANSVGEILDESIVRIDVDLQATEALDRAAMMVEAGVRRVGVPRLDFVVAGVPGPVDRATRRVCSATILSGWVGLDPEEELSRRLGVEVHAENDALLGALGERALGAAEGCDNLVYVKASHGIGAGLILDGRVFRGSSGVSGEIGHIHLADHGEQCRCGAKGCLEAVVSVRAVKDQLRLARPGVAEDELLSSDDPVTNRVFSEAGRALGKIVADLCNLLNPAAVVIGGELNNRTGAFVSGVRSSVVRYAQPGTVDAVEVIAGRLGERAELVGALWLARKMLPFDAGVAAS